MFKNLKFNKNYIYLFFIISALSFFSIDYVGESDIWFLLSHGRYVLNNGLPYTDILSMHTGLNFVMQQWLSSIIFYVIYNYLGQVALYLFIFFINCIITFLIYKLCLIVSDNKKFVSCFISVITTILLQRVFIVPRPQIFTFIILLVILIILELFSSKRKKYIYYMPLLSILLINLHASMWPMIFVFCMPYVAELILKKDKDVFILLGVMILSVIGGFVNPYGLGAMTYSLKSYGDPNIVNVVGEMIKFNLLGTLYAKVFSLEVLIVFFISNLIMLLYSNKKNRRVAHLLLFYGTFFMSLLGFRNVSLFLIGTIPFLVKYFDIKDIDEFKLDKKWITIYVMVIVIVVLGFVFAIGNKKYEFLHSTKNVVSYLNESESKNIKIYTDYSDGSYFEYHGYKPYLDTRAEVFIKKMNDKEDILKEYIDFNIKENTRDKFIKKYDFDYYVISSKNFDLINYLINYEDINFEITYVDKNVYLIKKVS